MHLSRRAPLSTTLEAKLVSPSRSEWSAKTGSKNAMCSFMIPSQTGFALLHSTVTRARTTLGQLLVMACMPCSTPREATIELLEMLYTHIHLTTFANQFECSSA